jgi:glycosyltransferase involved in cell wall biosynthesis
MASPRITVGIPVHNGEKYLPTAVDSVLRQDYEDFEVIISDNASTDSTPEICREYAARDKRIHYVRSQANIGAAPNFNRVFALAQGEYFKWLSHDDECYPAFLSSCMEVLEEAPDSVTLVYPLCEVIDEGGNFRRRIVEDVKTSAPRPDQRFRRVVFNRTSAQALCGLIRSKHLRQTRLRGSFPMDDCALLAELALLGELWEIPRVLLKIRLHPGNANRLHTTGRSLAAWMDPVNKNKTFFLPPEVRLLVEGFRSVEHVPLRPVDKLLCYATALAYSVRPMRNFAGKHRHGVLKWCRAQLDCRRREHSIGSR